MEKFVYAGGVALRYREVGNGEKAILFLHGYMESLDVWDDFTAFFYDNYRVITLDLPGHGISEVKGEVHSMKFLADTVYNLLRVIGVERCTVVGHSMGGYVALAFAKDYADMLDGLVLFHSSPFGDTPERADLRRREAELIKQGKKEMLAGINPGKCFAPQNRKRFKNDIEYLSEQIYMTEDEGAVAILNGIAEREPMNDMLHALKCKKMFIFGRFDEFIPVEYAEKIIEEHPDVKALWLENSGHMGFFEEPEVSFKALEELLSDNNL